MIEYSKSMLRLVVLLFVVSMSTLCKQTMVVSFLECLTDISKTKVSNTSLLTPGLPESMEWWRDSTELSKKSSLKEVMRFTTIPKPLMKS